MARKRKQQWGVGDYFTVELEDQSCAMGQVLSVEELGNAVCAFFLVKVDPGMPAIPPGLTERDLVSVQFVTRDQLDYGYWRVFANGPSPNPERYLPISDLRRSGYVGATVRGSGNIIDFLNACFRLLPWNGYHDPEYFDKLLIAPDRKPKNVIMKPR